MLAGELIKGHQPLPIITEPFDRFGGQSVIPGGELVPEGLACPLALGLGHGAQERAGGGLVFGGERIKDVDQLVVPAPLLGPLRVVRP